MNYVPNTLSKYQLYPKKWYTNGQQDFTPISVLGIHYNPKEDTIGPKQIMISYGKEYKGDLRMMEGPLITVNTSVKKKTREPLKQVPKTLRTILGLCNHFLTSLGS